MVKDSTKNEDEIRKFQKLAHLWSDTNSAFKILHQINPLRVEYILSKICNHFKINLNTNQEDQKLEADITRVIINNKSMLNKTINYNYFQNLTLVDIGCGGGLVSVDLAEFGINITGIDAVSDNIEQARSYANSLNRNIEFIYGEINDLVNKKYKYDIILCLEVLEHVDNLELFFEGLTKILKPGGIIILSTINRTLKAYLLAIVAGEYILKWIPINTHSFKKFIKPSEIQNFLNKTNLSIKELKGLNYDLINKTWKLSQNIDVNYFAYIR